MPAEVELVDARREDGLEGDQYHPDRGRDERDGVEVNVVLDCYSVLSCSAAIWAQFLSHIKPVISLDRTE